MDDNKLIELELVKIQSIVNLNLNSIWNQMKSSPGN